MMKLAILGWGRAGKDTAGEFLGRHTRLRYVGSTSMVVCPLIAAERGVPPEEIWVTRHKERKFWYEWANEYRKDDPAKLAKKCLERGDMVIGLRDKLELQACKDANLFDLIIWIERNVEPDPTVTFSRDDCDVIIDNNGTISQLQQKLSRLVSIDGVNVYKEPIQDLYLPNFAKLPALQPSSAELMQSVEEIKGLVTKLSVFYNK